MKAETRVESNAGLSPPAHMSGQEEAIEQPARKRCRAEVVGGRMAIVEMVHDSRKTYLVLSSIGPEPAVELEDPRRLREIRVARTGQTYDVEVINRLIQPRYDTPVVDVDVIVYQENDVVVAHLPDGFVVDVTETSGITSTIFGVQPERRSVNAGQPGEYGTELARGKLGGTRESPALRK